MQGPGLQVSAVGPGWAVVWVPGLELGLQVRVEVLDGGHEAQVHQGTDHEGGEPHGQRLQPVGQGEVRGWWAQACPAPSSPPRSPLTYLRATSNLSTAHKTLMLRRRLPWRPWEVLLARRLQAWTALSDTGVRPAARPVPPTQGCLPVPLGHEEVAVHGAAQGSVDGTHCVDVA